MEPQTGLIKAERYELAPEDIATLVASGIIPADTPDGTIRLFGKFCAETRLSPFRRQVHLVPRKVRNRDGEYENRYTIQTGIDGYRAVADRTGRYAGSDDYRFNDTLTEFQHSTQFPGKNPVTATATVYKLVGGMRCPFSATARWAEYAQTNYKGELNPMWSKMPYLMLGKCAEALALRKAFPDELGGIYTDEEMSQADVATTTVETPLPVGGGSGGRGVGRDTGATQTATQTPATTPEHPVDAAVKSELEATPVPVSDEDREKLAALAKKHSVKAEQVKSWLFGRYGVEKAVNLTREQFEELLTIIPRIGKGTVLPIDMTKWPEPLANEVR